MNPENPEKESFKMPEPGSPESLKLDAEIQASIKMSAEDLEKRLANLSLEQREAFAKAVKKREETDPTIQ